MAYAQRGSESSLLTSLMPVGYFVLLNLTQSNFFWEQQGQQRCCTGGETPVLRPPSLTEAQIALGDFMLE